MCFYFVNTLILFGSLQIHTITFSQMQFTLCVAVAHLVEALRRKPKGRGFDSRWCHWNFSLT
jgi:hypothetical protein